MNYGPGVIWVVKEGRGEGRDGEEEIKKMERERMEER